MKIWETDTSFLARWIEGRLSNEEMTEFKKSSDYEYYSKIISSINDFSTSDYDLNAEFDQIKNKLKRIQKTKKNYYGLKYFIAATVAIVIGLGSYFMFYNNQEKFILAKEKKEISLPDGSIINMNKGSEISYKENDWENNRSIDLKGEAFFEVEKGNKFSVKVGAIVVEVLGTSFNIKEESLKTVVVCYTGKVKVSDKINSIILEANELVEFESGLSPIKQYNNIKEPVWVNQIVTHQVSNFDEVINRFEEIYNMKVQGEVESGLLFSGSYPINDMQVACEQIFSPFGYKFQINELDKTILIYKD